MTERPDRASDQPHHADQIDPTADPASPLYGTQGLTTVVKFLSLFGLPGTALRILAERTPQVRAAQANALLKDLVRLCGDGTSIPNSQKPAQLLSRAIEAAAETALDEKIPILAKIAAEGITNPDKIDEALFKLNTFAQLEPFHVSTMRHVQVHEQTIDQEIAPGTPDVFARICDDERVARAVLADLERLGLSTTMVMGTDGRAIVHLTPYGQALLQEFATIGGDTA